MKKTACCVVLFFLLGVTGPSVAQSATSAALKLETTIPMADVQGRIDHISIDVKGQRLFVAALGNNSVEVIDLKRHTRAHSIPGLAEPQGIAYLSGQNLLVVANGADGSVRVFDGASYRMLRSIPFGSDADNLRLDPDNRHLWVGYGEGALGEFDASGQKLAHIKMDAHPESFRLETKGSRIFVNLPDSRKIAVVDRKAGTVVTTWETGTLRANFPMALDEADHRLFVVTRDPARFLVLDSESGKRVATLPVVGDCDDVFIDARRHRIYAIGGEGEISVFRQEDADHYSAVGTVKTVAGARTGFFSPEMDRLYIAVRKHGEQPAEIRIYAPTP